MTAPEPAEAPGGYTLVLPSEWRHIPLADPLPVLRDIVDVAFRAVPADIPPDRVRALRRQLEGQLRAGVEQAQEQGASDVYLPVEQMHGLTVPASVVVALAAPGDLDAATPGAAAEDPDPDPVAVVAALVAADDGTKPVEVDGAVGVRMERSAAAEPARQLDVDRPTRRVDYVLAVPDLPGRWLTVSFSTVDFRDDDQDLTPLLVELFDAMMTTFRWTAA